MLNLKKLLTKIQVWINLNRIRQTNVSGTTDANGNLRTNLPENAVVVLFGWNGVNVFLPFFYNGNWYVKVLSTNANNTALVNTPVAVNLLYIVGGVLLNSIFKAFSVHSLRKGVVVC